MKSAENFIFAVFAKGQPCPKKSNAMEGAFLQPLTQSGKFPLQPRKGHCWHQMKGNLCQSGEMWGKSPAARGEGDMGLAGPHKWATEPYQPLLEMGGHPSPDDSIQNGFTL